MNALPGEFKVVGRLNRKTREPELHFLAGEGVTAEQAAFMKGQLEGRRRTILHVFDDAMEPDKSFLGELESRGYAMATFKWSIFLFAVNRQRPKVLRSPVQRPGVLHAKWGRLPDDSSPDLVCSWHRPCSKGDSNLFHRFFSANIYLPGEGRHSHVFDRDLMTMLKGQGFDLRTFRFSVRHKDPVNPEDLA